ncbi:hypothetical protein ACS0TY_008172 [Phlomoides rotata]
MNSSGVNKETSPVPPTSSVANPPTSEECPRLGSGGGNASNSSPIGHDNVASRRPRGGQSSLVMGVPGQSAFTPYTRPPQPAPPHRVSPSFSRPSGNDTGSFFGGFGFQGAQVVPVGAGDSGGVVVPGIQTGDNPTTRKRVRGGGAASGNSPIEGASNLMQCSVCGKKFSTPRSLFGHMRAHRGRGWKGAHPPPTFSAEEEFADLRVDQLEVGNVVVVGAHEEGGRVEVADGGGAAEDEEGQNYRVPDLNNPPPEDST